MGLPVTDTWICHWRAEALMEFFEPSIGDRPLVYSLYLLLIAFDCACLSYVYHYLRCHTPTCDSAFCPCLVRLASLAWLLVRYLIAWIMSARIDLSLALVLDTFDRMHT